MLEIMDGEALLLAHVLALSQQGTRR